MNTSSGEKTLHHAQRPWREGLLRRRSFQRRRQGSLRHLRSGKRIPAAPLLSTSRRSSVQAAHRAHSMGRRELRDLTRRRAIAFVTNEGGISKLHLLDTRSGEGTSCACASGRSSSARLAWHHNNRDLGMTMMSARAPADTFSLDVITRSAHPMDRERNRRHEHQHALRARAR